MSFQYLASSILSGPLVEQKGPSRTEQHSVNKNIEIYVNLLWLAAVIGQSDQTKTGEVQETCNLESKVARIEAHHGFLIERYSMDAALIALTDRGARFTFLGEPFRSRQEIPNEDIVDIDFSQTEITDADVDALLPLMNLAGISFWNTGISDHAIERITQLRQLTRLNLCGTRITDASVSTLIGMALDYIDVADTQMTTHGVETLRAGLPSAEILS